MRNGKLLAEAAPSDLLAVHRLPTLEDVFLKLCLDVDSGEGMGSLAEKQLPGFLAAQRAKKVQESSRQQTSNYGSTRRYMVLS